MTSADDRTADALARWGNLSLEERLADRISAILFALEEIRTMIALAEAPPEVGPIDTPQSGRAASAIDDRDPEVEEFLVRLDVELAHDESAKGVHSDECWKRISDEAAPYALAFYFEIRRMDSLMRPGARNRT